MVTVLASNSHTVAASAADGVKIITRAHQSIEEQSCWKPENSRGKKKKSFIEDGLVSKASFEFI